MAEMQVAAQAVEAVEVPEGRRDAMRVDLQTFQ